MRGARLPRDQREDVMTMRALVLAVLLALTVAPAQSAEPAAAEPKQVWEILDAKTIIDACRAISEEKRGSGYVGLMAEGGMDSILCLEEAAKTQAAAFGFPAEAFARELTGFREQVMNLYQRIYEETPECRRIFCGMDNELGKYPSTAAHLERIIDAMVRVRKFDKF
jgi:hypothetical protein